jgi:hypothetical protein
MNPQNACRHAPARLNPAPDAMGLASSEADNGWLEFAPD